MSGGVINPLEDQKFNVSQNLAIKVSSMPPRFVKIAKWVTDNFVRVPFLTSRDAKKELGVHPYDMVLFAKGLGYEGWEHMRKEMANELMEDMRMFYDKERKKEIALRMYKNISLEKRLDERGCRACNYQNVFRISYTWFFDTKDGGEPSIRFCPACGHILNKQTFAKKVKVRYGKKSASPKKARSSPSS